MGLGEVRHHGGCNPNGRTSALVHAGLKVICGGSRAYGASSLSTQNLMFIEVLRRLILLPAVPLQRRCKNGLAASYCPHYRRKNGPAATALNRTAVHTANENIAPRWRIARVSPGQKLTAPPDQASIATCRSYRQGRVEHQHREKSGHTTTHGQWGRCSRRRGLLLGGAAR